jgi:hypothetical protein
MFKKYFLLISVGFLSNVAFCQLSWDWAKLAPGGHSVGMGIADDSLGNIYMGGSFRGTSNFDSTTLTKQSQGFADAFIAKYDQAQNLIWVKQFGQTGENTAYSIAVDQNLNVYFTGYHNGSFALTKLDSLGNLLWRTNVSGDASYNSIYLSSNEVYVCTDRRVASFSFSGVPITALGVYFIGAECIAGFGNNRLVVAHNQSLNSYDNNLNTIQTINLPIGTGVNDIALNDNHILVTGTFRDSLSFGNHNIFGQSVDFFVACFDTSFNCLWLKGGGGSLDDQGRNVLIKDNKVYVSGTYRMGMTLDTIALGSPSGLSDIFVAEYDLSDGSVLSVIKGGGEDADAPLGMIESKADGHLLITGFVRDFWSGINFGNILITAMNGNRDAFFAKTRVPDLTSTLEGQVTRAGQPAHFADMHLYSVAADSTHTLLNSQLTPADGKYSFMVNDSGTYALKAGYFYSGFINTYYPSGYIWNQASHISISKDTAIVGLDIPLIALPQKQDSAIITGTVLGYDSLPKRFIDMLLVENVTNIPVDFARTDTFGVYKFDSIPQNSYKILVDTAGFFMSNYHVVNVVFKRASTIVFDSLDYIIRRDKVYPINPTMVGLPEANRWVDFKIFPNPAQKKVYFEFDTEEHQQIEVTVFSMKGEVLVQDNLAQKQSMGVSQLPSGNYIIRIVTDKGLAFKKLMIHH